MINRRKLLAAFTALVSVVATPAMVSAKEFTSDRIIVTAEGKGQDVVLIPGLSSSPRVWEEMIKAVPGYRYHKVQVRGFAGADKAGNASGPVVAPVAEDIARYIRENKLTKVALIGHSMGGTMAMAIAARHPQQIDKLLVVDMLPFTGVTIAGPDTTVERMRPIAAQLVKGMQSVPQEEYLQLLEGTVGAMVDNADLRPLAVADSKNSDRELTSRAYGDLFVTDLRPELPAIKAKTLVHYVTPRGINMDDARMDAIYAQSFANLKGAVIKRAPNAAHFIMWDNAPWFQAEVKAFLAN